MTTGALAGMLPAALVVRDGLLALDLVDDLGLHRGTGHERRADGGAQHQDVVELDLVASSGIELFNAQHVTRLHLVLLAAGLEDRKHGSFPSIVRVLRPRRRYPASGVRGARCPAFGLRCQNETCPGFAPRAGCGLMIRRAGVVKRPAGFLAVAASRPGAFSERRPLAGMAARPEKQTCQAVPRPRANNLPAHLPCNPE